MNNEQSTCYVIADPNGAGKTTFALRYLPEITGCRNFVNTDLIADGLSPLDPAKVQREAGKILLREIRSNVEKGEDFAFETTLSGRSYAKFLTELKSNGWKIILFYLWIPGAKFSAARVQQRVESGGQDIPADAIARRYSRTVSNFLYVFIPLCDEAFCYDSSNPSPIQVFKEKYGERIVFDPGRYETILRCAND
jgi:predicted ABC-type ATPase